MAFPISTEQRSMLHLDRLLGPGILHNVVGAVPLAPDTTRDAVEAALHRLAERHQALRTVLADESTQLTADLPIPLTDAADAPGAPDARPAQLEQLRLDRQGAARAVAELDRAGGRVLLALDHLIADGPARALVLGELAALLAGADPGGEPALGFAAYCREQHRVLTADGAFEREIERWKRALDGIGPITGLSRSSDGTAPPPQPGVHEAWCWERTLPGGEPHRALAALVESTRTSLFTVTAALYATALWRWTGCADGVLFTPVSNRHTPQREALVANLVNERPVPYRIRPGVTVTGLAQQLGTGFLTAMRGSLPALPDLVDRVAPCRAVLHTPGCDYVQLQVTADDVPGRPAAAGERVWRWGDYRPSGDITTTVYRVATGAHATRLTTFHGGPAGRGGVAPAIAADIAELARRAAADPGAEVGRLADGIGRT
ncbi:hypothetical protein P3T35_001343 [Kitasatospora sp. GP30]|uniref:condensation domain-containing protein n=1 Tax=Kitasatospora sp. GP30 TaxID=3035084 RepID=UPI000C70D54E|nr:condensation domain-containing protein [Kitasatospora sp. GP30]MDH6139343.1 hypothetical protein [Kitasatospora sp. GP30]